jgi:hypothetical protein
VNQPESPEHRRTRLVHVGLSIGFAVLSALVLMEARRVKVAVIDSGLVEALDPAGFLALLGWALLAGTAVFAFVTLRPWPSGSAVEPVESLTGRPVVPLLAMIAYAALLPWIGFTLSTFVLLLIVFVFASKFAVMPALGIATAITGTLHLVFVTVLGVPFPAFGRFGI